MKSTKLLHKHFLQKEKSEEFEHPGKHINMKHIPKVKRNRLPIIGSTSVDNWRSSPNPRSTGKFPSAFLKKGTALLS